MKNGKKNQEVWRLQMVKAGSHSPHIRPTPQRTIATNECTGACFTLVQQSRKPTSNTLRVCSITDSVQRPASHLYFPFFLSIILLLVLQVAVRKIFSIVYYRIKNPYLIIIPLSNAYRWCELKLTISIKLLRNYTDTDQWDLQRRDNCYRLIS